LAISSSLNYLKFGSLNPISYGRVGGNIDLSTYIPLMVGICLCIGGIFLFRRFELKIHRTLVFAALVVAVGALLLIPITRPSIFRFCHGFLSLVVDARHISDQRIWVQEAPEQILMFWGLVKKSLGQSMPWIGITAVLLTKPVQESERRSFAVLIIVIAMMVLPFIYLSWHGGSSSNMRYFLPALPPLCILCSKLVFDLGRSVNQAKSFAATGAWIAIAMCAGWTMIHPSRYPGVQQILSTYLLLATALACIAAGTSGRFGEVGRKVALTLLGSGIALSMIFAFTDLAATARHRTITKSINDSLAKLPPKSLVYVLPEWVAHRLPGNGSIIAVRNLRTNRTDPELIVNALKSNYRVFIIGHDFDPARDVPSGVDWAVTDFTYYGGRMIEMRQSQTPR
jgi:hypothetical protein